MKQVFYTLSILGTAMLSLISCTPENKGTQPEPVAKDPTLTVAKNEFDVPFEGGNLTIDYTLENPTAGIEIYAMAEDGWIKNVQCSDESKVTLTVTANFSATERNSVLTIVYPYGEEELTEQVTIIQKGETVPTADYTNRRCPMATINYWGNTHSPANRPDLQLYDIEILSKTPNGDNFAPGSVGYYLSVFTTVESEDEIFLPDGTYPVSMTSDNVISTANSQVVVVNSQGNNYDVKAGLADGYITVVNDGDNMTIVGEIIAQDDQRHAFYFTYSGKINRNDSRYVSTLKEDVCITDGDMLATYYGDVSYNGKTRQWILNLEDAGKQALQVHICTDYSGVLSNGLPVGKYVPGTGAANTFIPGYIEGEYFAGSWFFNRKINSGIYAPLIDGEVNITAGSCEGEFTVEANFIDDRGNSIICKWTGVPTYKDETM